jgi:amino-acid N-acetyltransferase
VTSPQVRIRAARTADVPAIWDMMQPFVAERILLGKEAVALYEAVPEFLVAEDAERVVGFGALHVFWKDLAEVRTLAVDPLRQGEGIGGALLRALLTRSVGYGVYRVFCLTFEVSFFERHGFSVLRDPGIDPGTYSELVRSHDEGMAEFLELARVKQNTLGNTRMIRHLPGA